MKEVYMNWFWFCWVGTIDGKFYGTFASSVEAKEWFEKSE